MIASERPTPFCTIFNRSGSLSGSAQPARAIETNFSTPSYIMTTNCPGLAVITAAVL